MDGDAWRRACQGSFLRSPPLVQRLAPVRIPGTYLEDVPGGIERVLEIPNLHRLWMFVRHHIYSFVFLCIPFPRTHPTKPDTRPSTGGNKIGSEVRFNEGNPDTFVQYVQ